MRALSTLLRVAAAIVLRLTKVGLLVTLLAGIPYGLLTQIGSPLPDHLPTTEQLHHLMTAPVSDTLVIDVLALALWILWAAFVVSFAVEVVAAIRGRPRPRLGPIAPMQSLAGWLIAGITAGVLAAAPVMAVAGHAVPAAVVVHAPVRAVPAGAVTPLAAGNTHLPGDGSVAVISSVHGRSPVLASMTTAATRAPATQLPVYEVEHDDWLGCIAERYLGSFDRYPEIQRLNPDLIDDPDHIEPTWRLILPADAYNRGAQLHATGRLVVTAPANTPSHPGPGDPVPGAAPGGPSGGPGTPSASAAPSPSSAASPGVTSEPSAVASPTPSGAGATASAEPSTAPPESGDYDRGIGVPLPGGWISLPFAVALVAAGAMVWLRRRHRYVPKPLNRAARADATGTDPDLRPLPPVMHRIHRAARQQAPDLLDPPAGPQPTVADYTATAADERPDLPPVGPSGLDLAGLGTRIALGGLGLVGPGAESAARALLVATLSSGSPADPDAKGQVVIPADALATLLGADAVHLGELPRLQVTANLSEALMRADELIIERRRLLEDYDAAEIADMRAADPYHPPMPPVLLLSDAPPSELRARLTTTLHLGAPLQISAVLLGEWPRGDTLTVHADGHTDGGGDRLAVLDIPTTMQLLQVLREAHTGEPAATPPEAAPSDIGLAAPPTTTGDPAGPNEPPSDPDATTATATEPTTAPAADGDEHQTAPGSDAAEPPAASADGPPAADTPADTDTVETPAPVSSSDSAAAKRSRRRPVRIQLLGDPVILDRDDNQVPGLRHHARELLVYLAVHRNGADLSEIMEAFWPTAIVRRAGERLSTEAGNLRLRIRQAAGDKDIQPVVNTGSRYHLDPNLVDIDVWRLVDALRQAAASTDPASRAALLRQAVDAHTGTLAQGHDYDWIEQPREQLRRHGIRVRINLAELVGADDPAAAAELVRAAAALDPINEDVARQAMRALARVGDAAGVRAVLGQLRTALDDIDEEPSGETIALASELQRDITAGRRTGPTPPDHHAASDTP